MSESGYSLETCPTIQFLCSHLFHLPQPKRRTRQHNNHPETASSSLFPQIPYSEWLILQHRRPLPPFPKNSRARIRANHCVCFSHYLFKLNFLDFASHLRLHNLFAHDHQEIMERLSMMSSTHRAIVGEPAPRFNCKAVVNGRIKGS